MHSDRDDVPPPFTLCSDVDGMRYVLVDPADADMSGWAVELMDANIRWPDPNTLTSLSSFEQDTWFSSGEGDSNGLGHGTPKTAWVCDRSPRGQDQRLDPTGRHSVRRLARNTPACGIRAHSHDV
ncbi:hypothetical protein Z045_17370 [Rhodococcus pyridinivorans KG-16]|uniref:Uncharacterized protein n=1 Tax=Rhodococcus pyridinivorans KG-16 TaxID=1441730 RepID=A0A0V9UI88_9NOCA|nr:hypothetical protein [Rhodococcus pyridinivorans]KSZ57714.1 hypothetical protein Z045_17370 [Rhodococcus pyridinivorans KG-16]